MKVSKKSLALIGIGVIMATILFSNNNRETYAQLVNENQNVVKVGVLLYKFDDGYISLVRQNLEEIQKKNKGKVEFTFYDAKGDQAIQNQTIDTLLKNKSADFLLLNLVDVKDAYEVIGRIKEYNIPVVLFNREPLDMEAIKSYGKAYFVGTDSAQAGILQGKILINAWNKNKESIDVDGDNIMQYVMLMGERNNKDAIQRTEYSVSTIKNAGIQTEELVLEICEWSRELAKQNFEPVFLHYDKGIEAVISNNDEMAIGAIEVLQRYGYNTGDSTKTINVVGVDAIPEAQELINKGEMTGTVFHDPSAMAEACYTIGMNLFNYKNPLEGTTYEADETGVAVRIPYKEYVG